jgi:hypothetical protein
MEGERFDEFFVEDVVFRIEVTFLDDVMIFLIEVACTGVVCLVDVLLTGVCCLTVTIFPRTASVEKDLTCADEDDLREVLTSAARRYTYAFVEAKLLVDAISRTEEEIMLELEGASARDDEDDAEEETADELRSVSPVNVELVM